jgi:hypothetical protein
MARRAEKDLYRQNAFRVDAVFVRQIRVSAFASGERESSVEQCPHGVAAGTLALDQLRHENLRWAAIIRVQLLHTPSDAAAQ